jgi:hypothetical protein
MRKLVSDSLIDFILISSSITCDDCGEESIKHGVDDDFAPKYFYKDGWRIKRNKSFCPKCIRKKGRRNEIL